MKNGEPHQYLNLELYAEREGLTSALYVRSSYSTSYRSFRFEPSCRGIAPFRFEYMVWWEKAEREGFEPPIP